MKEKARGWPVASIILSVLLIISLVGGFYLNGNSKKLVEEQLNKDIDFFSDYVVAVNDYHIASKYFDLGGANLDLGNSYTEKRDYYYEFAIDYFDEAKEQFTDGKELLIHSESKLDNIKDISPNEFYNKEVQNRIKQNEIMFSLIEKYYLLVDYMSNQLYEINYGSETEATRYFNMYNDLIIEVNEDLISLSDISQEIDLAWDSDWYPLNEGA